MRNGKASSSALLIVLAGVTGSASAQEQITTDPTRPPIPIATMAPDVGGGGGGQLQTVMIAPGRNAAIINGVVVKIGDKYGDAVLERVAEDRVVLKTGNTRQELRLHPAVEKVAVVRAEPVAPAAEKSAPRKAKAKAKSKAAPKAKAKPKAAAQQGAKPATDGGAGAR